MAFVAILGVVCGFWLAVRGMQNYHDMIEPERYPDEGDDGVQPRDERTAAVIRFLDERIAHGQECAICWQDGWIGSCGWENSRS